MCVCASCCHVNPPVAVATHIAWVLLYWSVGAFRSAEWYTLELVFSRCLCAVANGCICSCNCFSNVGNVIVCTCGVCALVCIYMCVCVHVHVCLRACLCACLCAAFLVVYTVHEYAASTPPSYCMCGYIHQLLWVWSDVFLEWLHMSDSTSLLGWPDNKQPCNSDCPLPLNVLWLTSKQCLPLGTWYTQM